MQSNCDLENEMRNLIDTQARLYMEVREHGETIEVEKQVHNTPAQSSGKFEMEKFRDETPIKTDGQLLSERLSLKKQVDHLKVVNRSLIEQLNFNSIESIIQYQKNCQDSLLSQLVE